MCTRILLSVLMIFLNVSMLSYGQGILISEMPQLQWERVLPGVWKAAIGQTGLDPLHYADAPNAEAIKALGEAVFPLDQAATRSQVVPGRASIRLPLAEDERIYGLGLEFSGINRRKNVYSLKVDHYGGVKGYTHAPIPFYISSRGYGVLINSARRVKIHVGVGNRKDSRLPERIDRTTGQNWAARPLSDAVEASVQGEGLEVYVFAGQTPLEAVQRYNLFCGGGVLPPKWGLGFWHRMHTRSSAEDIQKEIDDFRRYNFPLDVVGLEPGWQSFAYPCSFDWDSKRFPDPKAFVRSMTAQGIKVNLWENPYVAPTSRLYDKIRPFTGSHTVWLGEVPDYTLPAAQKVLLEHHQRYHLDIGVSGYKIDEVDGYDFWLWPDHATFPSRNDAVEIRQVYGMILQDMLGDHFRQRNQRTYGLVRASYIGASHKPFVIYSDHYDHKGYVTALTNSSLAGVLWTPEIRSAESAEEWVRRFQTVCFSPLMMLNAWYSGTKPWTYPKVTDIIHETIDLRKRLLPYLYTSFHEYEQRGIPPFRSMVLEGSYPEEGQRLEVTDQYMMGPDLLVAPVFEGESERKVVLPVGDWYDFYTGERVGNGETIVIESTLARIPLFVRDGAIIPMLQSAEMTTLEVRHYGKRAGTYRLYNDDGHTFNYEQGDYTITMLEAKQAADGSWQGLVRVPKDEGHRYGRVNWRWMTH